MGHGSGEWLKAPDGPAIAGNEQRLAPLQLVQDGLGFLVQLFCRDYDHAAKVTPLKCPRKPDAVEMPSARTAMRDEGLLGQFRSH